jgi:hypothetical protein
MLEFGWIRHRRPQMQLEQSLQPRLTLILRLIHQKYVPYPKA